MQQAHDFLEESEALNAILEPLADADFERTTLFKDWTVNDVLQHLHFFNDMAEKSAFAPDTFASEYAAFSEARKAHGGSMVAATRAVMNDPRGQSLRQTWIETARTMTPKFAASDPKARVKWAGPDMSTRSSITARQMETWAHGQDIYDLLKVERENTDRLKNIAVIGVRTYGWTFVNRGEPVPEPAPFVKLTGPSGAIWEWCDENSAECIEGPAKHWAMAIQRVAFGPVTFSAVSAMLRVCAVTWANSTALPSTRSVSEGSPQSQTALEGANSRMKGAGSGTASPRLTKVQP